MARPKKKKKLGYRKTGNLEGWCGQSVKGSDSGNNAGELVKKELGPEKCRQCTHSPRTSLAHTCPLRAGWGELLLLVTVSQDTCSRCHQRLNTQRVLLSPCNIPQGNRFSSVSTVHASRDCRPSLKRETFSGNIGCTHQLWCKST